MEDRALPGSPFTRRLADIREIPPYISAYWGKARHLPVARSDWHSIAYHGLDVAAAGEAYLTLRPDVLALLSRRVGLPEEVAQNWLLFGFAIHDLGKYADCFQVKWPQLRCSPWQPGPDPGHGSVGTALWSLQCDLDSVQEEGGFGHLFAPVPSHRTRFRPWIDAIFGHHGRPVGSPSIPLKQIITPTAAADARDFVEECARLFPLASPTTTTGIRDENFKATSWLIAGIAMIADWIGSNQEWFPYEPPKHCLDSYWSMAQGRAQEAIEKAGLSRPAVQPGFSLRDALVSPEGDDDPVPSDLQKWAVDDFNPVGQSLVVIEDLTGAGKTEAALIAAHRLMKAGAAGGLYWALPTMATANGLYVRLARSYDRLYADPQASLVLAHGKRDFNAAFKRSVLPAGRREKPHGRSRTSEDESSSSQCAAWIADDRRKTFLADVGVGTIDQALLAVLPAKHQALRLAALSQRVLVIDEIHSYDPYVAKLIAALLEFHASLGGSAVLLSATMTKKLRAELVSAFAKGAKWTKQVVEKDDFPLVTVVTGAERPDEIKRASGRGTRRDLAVQRLATEDDAIAALVAAYERGKASVWIRNTVYDAIAATKLLRTKLGSEAVDLFHARFALGDRIDIEKRTIERFGKGSKVEQRKLVLVASQVVEQSLDLDFDVMISDLAPIDLLIQRAGRLHRHERSQRPDPIPILCVLAPDPVATASSKWFADMFPKGQYVYRNHGQLWLTMKHLRDAGGLNLKSASPRVPIEWVFSGVPPDGLLPVSGRAEGEAAAQRGLAQMNSLKVRDGYAGSTGSWQSDQITPTRLGSPQRTLRLARWDGATLAPWYPTSDGDPELSWRLSEVQVLAARVSDVVIDPALAAKVAAVKAGWPDMFDPPLLVPLRCVDGAWSCDVISQPGRGEQVGRKVRLCYDAGQGLRFV